MQLTEGFDLSSNNTMGLRSVAHLGAAVTDVEQIPALVQMARQAERPLHILGRGSNCLLRDDIDAVVAVMEAQGKTIRELEGGKVLLTAQAGEDWPSLVEWSVRQGLCGLENLAGIPGTVGAAPVQNIGAYGVELESRLHSLTAYDTVEDRFVTFEPAACQFAYRTSLFKQTAPRYIITSVTLSLSKSWTPVLHYPGLSDDPALGDALSVMNAVLNIRSAKLPDWHRIGNCGSFFHNPIVSSDTAEKIDGVPGYPMPDGRTKLSAAWLIDRCGFKGYRVGGAGIYDRHALIVVNHGGATYDEIANLSAEVKGAVKSRYGVDLVQEPIII
ncbi:UDP-N-acetylmuramate dehydrogenase [Notoacmeibacter ruber]|uniref:UDP-N-acetylenolpyruvoylglucosamine reductase n=1 Tax=Notoacmeibacter ruber TaxID=2670375 RepID=A0A3L7JG14_9HYPH|nr:UDP-N-acetylmuramate dehydrogenase [Notoacmeibacter ruber]RLQ88551.1 UDP-N-acetylmuramate dehydrogenase [Notoacmeibacter ruber]